VHCTRPPLHVVLLLPPPPTLTRTPPPLGDALRGKGSPATAEPTHRRKPQGRNKTQCVETSLLTLQSPNTSTYARTLTNQHGSHWQRRRNDATELAHADMTTLPKVDTSCTALSLMPTVNGNTVRSFSTHGHQSAAKGSSSTVSRSDIRLISTF
jgi:hypothetical protein